MPRRRIVSFLPSGTEMAYALALGDELVGVSHECDYPAEARAKPVVVRSALPIERMTQAAIDTAVSERLREGRSLYEIDQAMVRALEPDLIITQSLCDVCAPSSGELTELLSELPNRPDVVCMSPAALAGIDENLRALGAATGRSAEAEALIETFRSRRAAVEERTRTLPRPRVFCMEWFDPVYGSGHWLPEMVRIAGGEDRLSREGRFSVRVSFDEVVAWAPEVLVLAPCGFGLGQAVEHAVGLADRPGWNELPAVRQGRVYAVDANAYFARPGPRTTDGIELLAHLIHPEVFGWTGGADAYRRLDLVAARAADPAPLPASAT